MKTSLAVAAGLAALLLGASADAQLYRWVDEKGKVQYSDVPPPSAKGSKVDTVKPPAPATSAAPKAPENLKADEAEFQRRRIAREEAEAKQAQQRQVKCAAARRAQQDMDGTRLYRRGQGGERQAVDDAERAAIEQRVQKQIAENC
ncbi:MAG: DUF4124 domain-containing protein [Clostridia bacterium]